MATATVSYPTGATIPRVQVDPVLITVTGLTPSTPYVAHWVRPGTSTADGTPGAPVSERVVQSDAFGTVVIQDMPQVIGTHSFSIAPASGAPLDQFVPTGPEMGVTEVFGPATTTASYVVG